MEKHQEKMTLARPKGKW